MGGLQRIDSDSNVMDESSKRGAVWLQLRGCVRLEKESSGSASAARQREGTMHSGASTTTAGVFVAFPPACPLHGSVGALGCSTRAME